MILYQNALIKLDYQPAKDILYVDMPNVNYSIVPEFRQALDIIVEKVRTYDVKKLLLEARKSVIDLAPEEYLSLISNFHQELKKTRLTKGARIISGNPNREQMVNEVVSAEPPTFEFRTFSEYGDALIWLSN